MDSDASARTPVSDAETVSGWQVGIVLIGIAITLPLLYSAGELVRGIGLSRGIIAAVAGAMILSLMSVPAAIVGARTRLSSYMIIEHTFGYAGAKFVNFCFGIFLLGWYAVTAELFGRTLFLAAGELTSLTFTEAFYTIVSSILVIVTTVYGFKAIDRLALIAVPFLLLALVAVVVISLERTSFGDLLQVDADGLDMATAISAVVGAAIVGVVLTPDLSRYTRTTFDCVVASFVGQGGGMICAYVLGMIPVLVWDELEPMNYMFLIGYGGLALGVLVFATWTTNTVNLYSTALAARASIPYGRYRLVVVLSGIVGTFAALIGIADNLIDFLVVLGLLVPPIAGVYLCDFFLLGRTDFSPDRLAGRPAIRVNAVVAGIGSGVIATWMYYSDLSLTSLAPLDSLVISIAAYLALEKTSGMFGKTRHADRH